MGGQLDYFGLWLSQEFGKGHSKAKSYCTTYNSPQLSKSESFQIHGLEVWGVGASPEEVQAKIAVSQQSLSSSYYVFFPFPYTGMGRLALNVLNAYLE